jgi:hypothetical protein
MRFLFEVVQTIAFLVGDLGGRLIDKVTGYDADREVAEIRESIRRQYEGL